MKLNFYIIGVGGTGGNFAKELSRFLSHNEFPKHIHGTDIFLIDGDYIESKNLKRQPFFLDYVGMNKALALSELINDSFGMHVKAFPRYITNVKDLLGLIRGTSYRSDLSILIGCCDNHHCRKIMEDTFLQIEYQNLFYWDSANEFSCGEVVFAAKLNNEIISPVRSVYYPSIFEDELVARVDQSCEELNNSLPQHIATNQMAANILLTAAANTLNGEIPTGIVYFDAFKYYMQRFDSPISKKKEGVQSE